jgi:hypothetical protein
MASPRLQSGQTLCILTLHFLRHETMSCLDAAVISMSTTPEADFDLEKLFLPAWAKESPQLNRYAKYEGGESGRHGDRRQDRRDRPPRRPDFGAPKGPSARRQPDRGERPRGPRRDDGPRGRDRGPDYRRGPERSAPPVQPLPEVQLAFTPEELSVDMLTKQIRITGRAYPLFEIAQLILQKPERHTVTFSVKKKADGTAVQPLFICAIDDSLWLSEDAAVRHVLDRHFATFYQAERTKIDPPKGVYTFVAQCGMSGVVLGPPNYHDYQNQLRKLHSERFARMPFDAFKARVKIVKDEEVVKKWVEEQSWKTEYLCLNLPEPVRLPSLDEVEKHFRQLHLPNIVKPVETHRAEGAASRNIRDRELMRLLRQRWEEQKRFPLQVATVLSQQFASRGLQFFKVNKTVTHVAVARPHFLDLESTPVSESVKRIVDFINATPKCTHRQLLEALAPRPPAPPAEPVAAPAEGEAAASAPAAPTPVPTPAPTPASAEPTPEMAVVMTDLHWLIHQGHVIEFANGMLETAKKPVAKPPKPAAPAEPQPAAEETVIVPLPEAPAEATAEAPSPVAVDPATPEAPFVPPAGSEATPEAAPDNPPPPTA